VLIPDLSNLDRDRFRTCREPLLELDDPTRLGIHPLEWSSPSLRKRDPKHLYGMALMDWEPLSAKKHFN
jgi:hypothetical protein